MTYDFSGYSDLAGAHYGGSGVFRETLTTGENRLKLWAAVAAFLVCGYGLWGRAFAYIGIPSAKLFIGDVTLALFVVCCTSALIDLWIVGLLYSTPLSAFCWGLIFFQFYGVLEVARGLWLDYPPLPAVQELVFNLYPIYFFMGIVAALAWPKILGHIVRLLALTGCLVGLVYYVFFRDVVFTIAGSPVTLRVGGAGMALLGLSYFNLRRWWPIIAISGFFTLADQVRGVWLGLLIALSVQSILAKKFKRLVVGFGALILLLFLGYAADVRLPSPAGRGGAVATREIIARAIAAVDEDAAREYSPKNAAFYAGTAHWRQMWWREIWSSVHDSPETALLGYGYGFPLYSLVPYLRNFDDLRTPHSEFYFCLGYTGWIGVALFFGFQAMIGTTLFRAWRIGRDSFGFSVWASSIVTSLFENGYETPFSAIPQYLMLGMAAADALRVSGVAFRTSSVVGADTRDGADEQAGESELIAVCGATPLPG